MRRARHVYYATDLFMMHIQVKKTAASSLLLESIHFHMPCNVHKMVCQRYSFQFKPSTFT